MTGPMPALVAPASAIASSDQRGELLVAELSRQVLSEDLLPPLARPPPAPYARRR